jgi:hypothetical protein
VVRRARASEQKPKRKPSILESMTGVEALLILKLLIQRDRTLGSVVEAMARDLRSPVDVDGLAADVHLELEMLDVEDVWERSGSHADGYTDPGDASWEMFEEALEPFLEEMKRLARLSMRQEAGFHCRGILKGIYDFEMESDTEYESWAPDAPGEFFSHTLREWRKLESSEAAIEGMLEFIVAECPKWSGSARKLLLSRK